MITNCNCRGLKKKKWTKWECMSNPTGKSFRNCNSTIRSNKTRWSKRKSRSLNEWNQKLSICTSVQSLPPSQADSRSDNRKKCIIRRDKQNEWFRSSHLRIQCFASQRKGHSLKTHFGRLWTNSLKTHFHCWKPFVRLGVWNRMQIILRISSIRQAILLYKVWVNLR